MNRVEIKKWAKTEVNRDFKILWKGIGIYILAALCIGFFEAIFDIIELIPFFIAVIMIPLQIGLVAFFINFVKKKEYNTNVIFNQFRNFIKIVCTMLLMSILIGLGTVCFVIPGIILGFSYSMVPYLLVERTDLSVLETLTLSRKMMRGHKLDAFIFSLSFIGWIILSLFTLGILFIWLFPYIQVATTKFYLNILDDYNQKSSE